MFQKKQFNQGFLLLVMSLVFSVAAKAQPVFSIKPLALIYQSISGQPQSTASVILPANKNLHDLQFSVTDMKKLQQAEVIYWLGAKASPELEKMRLRFSEKAWRSLQQEAHSWLDPQQLPALIDAMATAMSAQTPLQREFYWQRATVLKQELQKLFEQAATMWPDGKPSLLIGHSAFEPLLAYLQLPTFEYYQGHSHGGQQTGFKSKALLLKKIQAGEIHCVLEEPDVHFSSLIKRFPQLIQVTLEPMAKTIAFSEQGFVQFMQQSIQQLQLCQKQ